MKSSGEVRDAVDLVTMSCHAYIYYPSVSCCVTLGCTLLNLTSTLFTSVRAYFIQQTSLYPYKVAFDELEIQCTASVFVGCKIALKANSLF